MQRAQRQIIIKDLAKKLVILVGPRQSGKTWLAKDIARDFKQSIYLNYDSLHDRAIMKTQGWLPTTDLLILDELHKMPKWKNYLKGLYDTKPDTLRVLVTGSARLEVFHRMGDSLAGRFYIHHLFPFSLSEIKDSIFKNDLSRFLERGGFPEPFLSDDPIDAMRWRAQYIDSLIRTDIFDIEMVHHLKALENVLTLLRHRVGSPISYQSIAEDVGIAPNTVKKYIQLFEALFIVFRITPFSKKITRSLVKEPKIYFFDTGMVENDGGARLENFAAVSLFKSLYAKNDTLGTDYALHYLKTKEGKEVDFAVVNKQKVEQLIEIKSSDSQIHPALAYFKEAYDFKAIQLVQHCRKSYIASGIEIMDFVDYFNNI